MLSVFIGIATFLVGLFVGLVIWHKERSNAYSEVSDLRLQVASLQKELEAHEEKLKWVATAEENMRDAFKALASDALKSNAETLTAGAKKDLEGIVNPLKKNLDSLDGHVRELEKSRQGAYKSLEQQLSGLRETHSKLQETTVTLTQALRSPTVRGRWGELQLRRVVEMAGMQKNVDFHEQVSAERGRPDMTVRLPNDGVLPVDAKVPLDSYLAAMESPDEESRNQHLAQHAKAVRARVNELGQKQYWDQFDKSPDFVVMFVPNEACLGAAFEQDSELLEYAIGKRVLISSPVTLLGLLSAVAYGWQQHQITENVIRIAKEGQELYGRLETFIDRFAEVGKSLGKSIEQYNKAVGSLDRRLMPAARRFRELGVTEMELEAPEEIDVVPSLPASSATPASDDD
jgi:DNA recombination protein RmuC